MSNLINLNQIAQKVKEDQAKRKNESTNKQKVKFYPFYMTVDKEDLNNVMTRYDILKQINRDL